MPEHIEIETQELRERVDEIDEEQEREEKREKREKWLSYVGLSTAILAVIAAVGALQSGTLINEALISQIKASDTWNEYQASRLKDHTYTIALNAMLDANASNRAIAAAVAAAPVSSAAPSYQGKPVQARAAEYRGKIQYELDKETDRSKEARKLETEAAENIERQHRFEYSVALIQVAIALSAVAALVRMKPIWFVALASGAIGVAFFIMGFAGW